MSNTTFDAIKIGIASPEMIREWSYGEVKKPETINYRTLKPETSGLFCERIFGPIKDWECHCGKYKKIRYKGKICDKCGVEVTKAKVRRERMGHIELAAPVSHIWYFKGIPSRMGLILDISPRILEKLLYFACYVVTDPGPAYTGLHRNQILTDREYRDLREKYEDDFKAGMGAEAVKELLSQIDCEQLSVELRNELKDASGQKKAKLVKRLEVVEAFRQSGNRPEWMIIDVLPVIPPDIRPMVQLDGGRFATSDLNDLYRRVINRNNRLKKLIQLSAPDIIVRNEKRMLQEAVDALIDNGRRGRAVTGVNSRVLKSLSDMLKGKQGRFRQNLLGKRVDYSGRSVIVVGPDLKLFQCGVPKEMAIELFRPFIMKKLVEDGSANNIKSAKKMVDKGKAEVWDALDDIIKEHPVLLNRAPTLHRLGIQAFEPILVEGRALKLHPLVCTAYNADFDGDQMAIHVPLSAEAQAEARILMLSANNLLRPQDGHPVTVPTQDMIMGAYYLTFEREEVFVTDIGDVQHTEVHEGKVAPLDLIEKLNSALQEGQKPAQYTKYDNFASEDEAMLAYDRGLIGMHTPIHVRVFKEKDGIMQHKTVVTTVGRIIYNGPIPQDLGFVDRSDPDKYFDYEIGFKVDKKKLGVIVDKCITHHGFTRSTEVLDAIKAMGFKYSTLGALTISISDMTVPERKKTLIRETEEKVIGIEKQYKRGFITNEERARLVISEWEHTTKSVSDELEHALDQYNPIYMMSDSGARGSMNQIRQLAGMRGLMANTSGKTIEIPIKANFREGLSVREYFTSSRGARKGLADTALRTADSGYLTRRLVDGSQDVIIREDDCGTTEGVWAYALTNDYFRDFEEIMSQANLERTEEAIWKKPGVDVQLSYEADPDSMVRSFADSIHGCFPVFDIPDPATGEVLTDENGPFTRDRMLLADDAKYLMAQGIVAVRIRSVLDCEAKRGVCSKCYGMNLATGEPVSAGEAVGVIAAQSIGEPGTQLTMRTFHTGGVAGDDITQGLPRVEELFEARRPKKMTTLAEISGEVTIEDAKKANMVTLSITGMEEAGETVTASGERWSVLMPAGSGIRVKNGDIVHKGDRLTDGQYSPHDVLRVMGLDAAHLFLTQEVQKVYRQQGVDINDKHIEVIVRQMMRKIRIDESGDTDLLSGSTVDLSEVKRQNAEIDRRNQEPREEGEMPLVHATGTRLLMGITKASLATESFLSAASFQETTKVLTEAAIKGKVDHLIGLKENVIIGKLIPAGSGLSVYRDFDLKEIRNTLEEGDVSLNNEAV